MPQLYKITFNIADIYGYIAYDPQTQAITVDYPDERTCAAIKDWLAKEHEINTPVENGGTNDFAPKKYLAARSVSDFETVLTRIWQHLGVHIDWSFPAECI